MPEYLLQKFENAGEIHGAIPINPLTAALKEIIALNSEGTKWKVVLPNPSRIKNNYFDKIILRIFKLEICEHFSLLDAAA